MQLKIQNGVVELSGAPILSSVNIEINDTSKIGVVGRNGCGKTTLLKLISGSYKISKLESDTDSFFAVSGKPIVGVLSQMTFADDSKTMVEEIRSAYTEILNVKEKMEVAQMAMDKEQSDENIKSYTTLLELFTNLGGFYFEKEYESAIKHFGFNKEEKIRPLSEFSGGQRTKIAFLKLLLSKPDILLLDEPTNHLDIEAVEWLEDYINSYKKAVVIVSHDRMFLDNTINIVYEVEHGKTHKYVGNYSQFTEQKKIIRAQQAKEYENQKKEIERLNQLVIKFKYKPTKAAMAQSKLKQIERMVPVEAPESYDMRTFHADFEPTDPGVKDVMQIKDLKIGYSNCLSTINLDIKRGQHVGIIGGNGLGKSTFIKTIMGIIPAICGEYKIGPRVAIGYFDQQMAQYKSDKTVLNDFLTEFPNLTEFEGRSALAAFLFTGEEVFKQVNMLSGGERVRLALCKILKRRPNFLILDEPTNHMDIVGKETLEDMLKAFTGTVLFVSHDRYFVRKISDSLLVFTKDETKFYPYGYTQYMEECNSKPQDEIKQKQVNKKTDVSKGYTTPAKEKAKLERDMRKSEEKIARLEETISGLKDELTWGDNISDYLKLNEIQTQIDENDALLFEEMNRWEKISESYSQISKI